MALPRIIQGGMGAGVSNWELARAVSLQGQLGVVSSTGIEVIVAHRLRMGDDGGHVRRALDAFPDQAVAARILRAYFADSAEARARVRLPRPHRIADPEDLLQDTIAANFVEVFLAKEGHDRPVGINLLTKIQLPTLASLYGAMLAGVDYVIMGAGIPREIPAVLDQLSEHGRVSLALHVEGAAPDDDFRSWLEPRRLVHGAPDYLKRPSFYPIVSSNLLATMMVRKASGRVDGLVVEGPSAGGHNAPPRGGLVLGRDLEPVYGPKDDVDTVRIAELGVPFYLAGGYGVAGRLKEALGLGAAGVQVGTAFAFCRESGLLRVLKDRALLKAAELGRVVTDVLASPTGFPFKVLSLEGTLSDLREYLSRPRSCNLGFLRALYRKEDGEVGYRCPAEPEASWVAKGGDPAAASGRKCLCNALLANLGLGLEQPRGYREKPLLTVGSAFDRLGQLIRGDGEPYSAKDVIAYLLGDLAPQT
ncbi:MAG: nitronate monooxygenase [Acidobacteriota bacterium]